MEQCKYYRRLNHHNKRNSEHKFYVLGLVAHDEHCDEHSNAAAERGEQEQGLFGGAELNAVLFRDLFIVNADDNRNYRHYGNVCQQNGKNDVIGNEFEHNYSPFYELIFFAEEMHFSINSCALYSKEILNLVPLIRVMVI